jgi:hypothetical protein
MTDSASLVPNVMGISSDCQYNLKPSAVRSRSYRSSVVPSNKSVFAPQDVAIFAISGGRRNTYLDTTQSYMRFTIKNNDTTASTAATAAGQSSFQLDNNAACVINRLDIFHSSNLIETIQNYNQLMTVFLDTNINPSQKLGLSCAYGTTPTAAAGTDISRQGAQLYGTIWNTTSTAASNVAAQQQTFCLPIISGTIGLGAEKFLPLGKLSDDIRCEFTIESQLNAVVYNKAPNAAWSIVSFELELCIVELSDEGQAMVDSYTSPEMPIYIHSNSWRAYTSNLASSTSGGISILVPARFGSLKTIYLCPRRATEIAGADLAESYALSSRINPNFAQYWWRVGSALLPAKYVVLENSTNTGAYAEAFMELQKTFHSISSPENASVLPANIYNVGASGTSSATVLLTPATSTTVGVFAPSTKDLSYRNGFLIGQELESFALRSDVLLSGYNTLSQNIFFEAQINTPTPTAYTLNFFAGFDQIIVIENGIMSVRF